jgi:hypothetical protein
MQMRNRRFVSAQSGIRLGDAVRIELRNTIGESPSAIAKVREKNAELNAKVAIGEMTRERAFAEYLKFARLIIAHVREHGSDTTQRRASDEEKTLYRFDIDS